MLENLKAFLFRFGFGEHQTLKKHDEILEQIDHATLVSRLTIEEHIKLRGFPYSRLLKAKGETQ